MFAFSKEACYTAGMRHHLTKNRIRCCLILLLFLLLLSGCSSDSQKQDLPAETVLPTAAPTAVPTPVPTPEPTPTPVIIESFPVQYSETLLDTEDCGLSVQSLGLDQFGNRHLHLLLENRSKEIQTWRFSYPSVNGLATDGFTCRVAVGKAQPHAITVFGPAISYFGEGRLVSWESRVDVTSAEHNREPYLKAAQVTAYPFGPGEVPAYEAALDPDARLIMDNDLVTVYITSKTLRDTVGEASVEVTYLNYLAFNHTSEPLALTVAEENCRMDGAPARAELSDGMGPYAAMAGYIPFSGTTAGHAQRLEFTLQVIDPTEEPDLDLTDARSEVSLDISRLPES